LTEMTQTTLLYDEDCGMCRDTAAILLRWAGRDRLRTLPLRGRDADNLLSGMDSDTRMASWHLVSPEGRISSGANAVRPLFSLLPGGQPLAILAAIFPVRTRSAYLWIARNRRRISRWLGKEQCQVDSLDRPGQGHDASWEAQ
jgi:predicted DCC family thiol-disulfide oxidoreductase YuxK